MKTQARSALALCAALTAIFGSAEPVAAQTSNASANTLEEVIVTARRTEERLQDVPISISVFSQEQLMRNNVTSAIDLATVTPSLSVNNNFGNDNASFAIRGFVQDIGTPPSVGTYFADVVVPRGPTQGTTAGDSAGPGSFFDLQNLQVLKGPQGTLFGRNTTGGAVLLVPQKPTSKFEGYGELSAGNYAMKRVQAAINLPFSDTARLRIAADYQKRNGYLENHSGIGPEDFNDVDYFAARASLVLDLMPNLENYTIASYSKSDNNGTVEKMIAASPVGTNPLNVAAGFANFIGVFSTAQLAAEAARGAGFYDVQASMPHDAQSTVQQWQLINTTTWRVSDELTLKNIASYAEFSDVQKAPLFGANWQLSTLPAIYQFVFQLGIPSYLYEVSPAPGHKSADQSTYTEELQLQGSALNQRLTYQGGAYFEWSDPLSVIGNQTGILAPCTDLAALACTDPLGMLFTLAVGQPTHVGSSNVTVGKTAYRDRGLYAQSTYSITDQFKLTGGVRYTWDDQTNTSTRYTYTFPVTAPFTAAPSRSCTDLAQTAANCVESLEAKSNKPTWVIDFDYKPTEDMLLYAKYARGYRAGGIVPNAPADLRTFNPEKVDNYELGLKTTFRGPMPGIFNIAAFYNDFSDQQLQIGLNAAPGAAVAPTSAIANAGKSRISGAEVEFAITPVRGLVFDINYSYLKAEIREIAPITTTDPNYVPAAVFISSGTPLVLSPENKIVASGRYTLPLDKSIGAISLGATYSYTSQQQANYAYLDPAVVAMMGGNYGTLPSYALLNLDLGWTSIFGSGVDLTAFGTNVTNKEYYSYVPGLGSIQGGAEFAQVAAPRMYGVRLRYRFGS
jgi:iron complex outermembrane recepter protein